MNDRNLLEEIEESQFRLALRSAAEQEGRALLKREQQMKSESFHQLSDERRAVIARVIARECRKLRARPRRVRNQIVAMLAALLVLGGVSILSVEALRVPVLNFFREVCESYSRVFSDESAGKPVAADYKGLSLPSHLPEGMRVKEPPQPGEEIVHVLYEDGQGRFIEFIVYAAGNNLVIDNEDAQEESVMIAGQEGTIIENPDGLTCVVWGTVPRFQLYGNLPRGELLRVAESVQPVEENEKSDREKQEE